MCTWLCIPGFSLQQCLEKTSQRSLQLPKTTFCRFLAAACVWSPLACHVILTYLDMTPPSSSSSSSSSFLSGDVGVWQSDGRVPRTWFQFEEGVISSLWSSPFLHRGVFLTDLCCSQHIFFYWYSNICFSRPVAMDYGRAAIMSYENTCQKCLRV